MNLKSIYTLSALLVPTLVLSGCSHAPVQSDHPENFSEQRLKDDREEEALFVSRTLAQEGMASEIVAKAVAVWTQDELKIVTREAQTFLSTTEKITATNLASKFTPETGVAFLKHLQNKIPAVFTGSAMKNVVSEIEAASADSAKNTNFNRDSNLTVSRKMVQSPELDEAVEELKLQSPSMAGAVYRVFKNVKVIIADKSMCALNASFSELAKEKITSWFSEQKKLSYEVVELKPANPQACFLEAAANRFVSFLNNNLEKAQNLAKYCKFVTAPSATFLMAMNESDTPKSRLRDLASCH